MLYTQEQLISYAAYCLKKYGVTDPNGGDLVPSHATRTKWELENNIAPIRREQVLTIELVEGIKISAVIESIEPAGE